MDPELLERVCCPETHQRLRPAEPALIQQLNQRMQSSGGLSNRGGRRMEESLDGGLLREDGRWLYPIVHGIPILLMDEAIDVSLLNR